VDQIIENAHRGRKLSVLYSVDHNGVLDGAVGGRAIQRRYGWRVSGEHLKDDMACNRAWSE